ncbi:glycosyltransferase family 2 protein [Ovoidimarina sediminis]|uniref:glycosyltransferase family 2 protein n=1 Tax=Ovoidimarina sediminis TaxID=3079856 RepID=UPI00290857B5|nr:glycosyltransferase family 2 protein [Rhodophyticola sp. MJ-SS7]MDU8946142.1 glycosyltransferase family 2 protein [Rhodophyticola sp. MJ-SS7]
MISIIIPAYNSGGSIGRAIASVRAQSCTDWELIVVDDGSTDNTRAVAKAVNDPRVKVLYQTKSGASTARNAGLNIARGDYVTFLDADDTIPGDALELRAELLEREPSIDIVHGAVRVFEGERVVRCVPPDLRRGPLLDRLARLEEGVFVGVCYMLRREKIGGFRFPESLTHCEDLAFFLNLAHYADLRYGAVGKVVYEYRLSPGSAMSNLDGLEAGYLYLLRQVAGMERISEGDRSFLRRRVERILFRSWLRRGRPMRAFVSRSLVASAANGNL